MKYDAGARNLELSSKGAPTPPSQPAHFVRNAQDA